MTTEVTRCINQSRKPLPDKLVTLLNFFTTNTLPYKLLLDQEWIQALGQREVPGRPTLYGTTTQFLDHFNLKSLTDLPPFPVIETVKEPESAELSAA